MIHCVIVRAPFQKVGLRRFLQIVFCLIKYAFQELFEAGIPATVPKPSNWNILFVVAKTH